MLTYAQTGMVALCYVALIAALALKFTGGQPRHLVLSGLLGGVLGLGSLIPGRIAKHCAEAEGR